jgi:protein required for attachment to host cells
MAAFSTKREWILVASRDEVRVFARAGLSPLSLIYDIGNPLGVLRTGDLESDRPGRATDNRMHARHAYSTEESAKDRSLRNFYREVLDTIDHALLERRFDTLTLVAEPRLLGIIRALLPERLSRVIEREIPKDLSHELEPAILGRLMQG